jgi:hypothetical protein
MDSSLLKLHLLSQVSEGLSRLATHAATAKLTASHMKEQISFLKLVPSPVSVSSAYGYESALPDVTPTKAGCYSNNQHLLEKAHEAACHQKA